MKVVFVGEGGCTRCTHCGAPIFLDLIFLQICSTLVWADTLTNDLGFGGSLYSFIFFK